MENDKTIMELLDEIIALSKNMEVACKDLRENAFNIFPKLPTKEENHE